MSEELTAVLKRSLVAGVALVAPLFVTVVAVQLVFGWVRGFLTPVVEGAGLLSVAGNSEVAAQVLAAGLLLVGLILLGYLAQRSAGAYVFGLVDRALGRVPVVSVVYNGVRQVSDALTSREDRFESVVLVEYPREGVYSFGFVTAETSRDARPEEETFNVYVPNSPNPTQGHLILAHDRELEPVDLSVSRAIRLLVTTGIAERAEEMEQLREETEGPPDDVDLRL